MHRVSLNLLIIICFFGLSNCQNKELIKQIEGVWVFDYQINNLYLNDTTEFFKSPSPTIVDFGQSGNFTIKSFGYRDTTMNWSLNSDTLIQLGRLEYRLHSVNSDSLTLINYNPADTFWIVYKRPIPTNIELSQSEIKDVLVNSIWSIHGEKREWETNIQYFQNNTMMYRYPMIDLELEDSTHNLQIESYGVGYHKGLYFLFNYMDWEIGNGNIESINQILTVDSDMYSLNEYQGSHLKTLNYKAKDFDLRTYELTKSKLLGRWASVNSEQKSYGRHIPERAIENGRLELFKGVLIYEFNMDGSAKIYLNNEGYASVGWILTKDCNAIILEHHINEPDRNGIYVEPVNILDIDGELMTARIQRSTYYLESEKPRGYLLNIEQEFRKSE